MICELCKRLFSEAEARKACSGGCGSSTSCQGVRCPYCYYEMVPRPKWLEHVFDFFRFNRNRKSAFRANGRSLPLHCLPARFRAEVTHLKTDHHHTLQKMIAMGVLPGTEVSLVQKYPSYVFQIGRSQFSIDRELASCIYVRLSQQGTAAV